MQDEARTAGGFWRASRASAEQERKLAKQACTRSSRRAYKGLTGPTPQRCCPQGLGASPARQCLRSSKEVWALGLKGAAHLLPAAWSPLPRTAFNAGASRSTGTRARREDVCSRPPTYHAGRGAAAAGCDVPARLRRDAGQMVQPRVVVTWGAEAGEGGSSTAGVLAAPPRLHVTWHSTAWRAPVATGAPHVPSMPLTRSRLTRAVHRIIRCHQRFVLVFGLGQRHSCGARGQAQAGAGRGGRGGRRRHLQGMLCMLCKASWALGLAAGGRVAAAC